MKRIISFLLLAISLNAMMYGQFSKKGTDFYLRLMKQLSTSKKGTITALKNQSVNQNLQKPTATFQSLYVSKFDLVMNGIYQSQRVTDYSNTSVINASPSYNAILTEGTMDDEGYWYGLFLNSSEPDPVIEGNTQTGKPLDEISPFTIKKIDKSTGQILAQYPFDDHFPHYGITFNPVDKLIYFTEFRGMDDKAVDQKPLSKGGGANQTVIYSLNPKTGVIIPVKVFNNQLIGLACTNDGVFYTVNVFEMTRRLAKFRLNSPNVEVFGADLIADEHLLPLLIDLEINPLTGKCYMASLNLIDMGGKQSVDSDEPPFQSELREISLSTGCTTLEYYWGSYIVGGLAFDRIVDAAVNTGKYIVTSPNGGETLQAGKYYNVTWRKLSGIIPGSIQLEYSTDGGTTWKKINTIPLAGVLRYAWLVPNISSKHCLVRIVNYLSRKEYDRSDDEFTITNTGNTEAINFPNPFNPSTKIVFTLAQKAMTSLRVYNSLGEQVAELVNNQLESGVHEFEFNASNLSSGIYFYKLEYDGKSEMHKMILMK